MMKILSTLLLVIGAGLAANALASPAPAVPAATSLPVKLVLVQLKVDGKIMNVYVPENDQVTLKKAKKIEMLFCNHCSCPSCAVL
jgi:hypothetical protein